METIGSLIDKLTIINIRLWNLEDIRRDKTRSDKERLSAADKVAIVNSQRAQITDEIDQLINSSIKNGESPVQLKMKLY